MFVTEHAVFVLNRDISHIFRAVSVIDREFSHFPLNRYLPWQDRETEPAFTGRTIDVIGYLQAGSVAAGAGERGFCHPMKDIQR